MSLMHQGEIKRATDVLEKEMDSKKQMNLVNSSRAYAILYHLTWVVLDLHKRGLQLDNKDQEIADLELKLDTYAKKCQEKNL
jgi:hypothetical protein